MNVYGSCIHATGSSACGGILHSQNGDFMNGFYWKIISKSSIFADFLDRFPCSFSYGHKSLYYLHTFNFAPQWNCHFAP